MAADPGPQRHAPMWPTPPLQGGHRGPRSRSSSGGRAGGSLWQMTPSELCWRVARLEGDCTLLAHLDPHWVRVLRQRVRGGFSRPAVTAAATTRVVDSPK
eukprot:13790593-Alexandrium_andersonii.AAC.1